MTHVYLISHPGVRTLCCIQNSPIVLVSALQTGGVHSKKVRDTITVKLDIFIGFTRGTNTAKGETAIL